MRISSPPGVSFEFSANGHLRRIDYADVMINLFLGNGLDPALMNIHLRLHGNSTPLLGPSSPSIIHLDDHRCEASGNWQNISYRIILVPAAQSPAWFWHVELLNQSDDPVEADLIFIQDVGLAGYSFIRQNEYFVSQYIDHSAFSHPKTGHCIISRQNQPIDTKFPSLLTGSLHHASSFATDALQTHGFDRSAPPVFLRENLPGSRLQHEHSIAALQEKTFTIPASSTVRRGFFSAFLPDQREPASPSDLSRVAEILAFPEAMFPENPMLQTAALASSANLFSHAPALEIIPATNEIHSLRHAEYSSSGTLLSGFTKDATHLVTSAKEALVLRPHGHILRSGASVIPDESALTSTVWMEGVFHSMVTQGHVSINRFLSTNHSYLGLFHSYGMRVFVEIDGTMKRLGTPAEFLISPSSCTWVYPHARGTIMVTSAATGRELILSLRSSSPCRFLVSSHIALNGDDGSAQIPAAAEFSSNTAFVRPGKGSELEARFPEGGFSLEFDGCHARWHDDSLLFDDGISRNFPFLTLFTDPTEEVVITIRGHLVPHEKSPAISADLPLLPRNFTPEVSSFAEILPWFVHNAFVHYLSPRGLEQYSGGGWGTRDVCQGAFELLLALGSHDALRDLLHRVFTQQNPDGDWPQWFMFFDRERSIRPGDSHGDIVYWPLLALGQYLITTGDASFLDEKIPFFSHDKSTPPVAVRDHVEAALGVIRQRVIPGTKLAAYGHGDWNDSLQPARPEMRNHLCSSWTVTLNYQTLNTLSQAYGSIDLHSQAKDFRLEAAGILKDFQRLLIPGGTVAGLAMFDSGEIPRPLLHPDDKDTGLSYSLLPMIHAIINDLFTPRQAAHHLDLIDRFLSGPDGARLFDKPIRYHGGKSTWFQRAETATFFGREIGIMYTHAHLRYAEALARVGHAEKFLHALRQAIPIDLREIIPSATLRQANCYYSSSDAGFPDRYAADAHYPSVLDGSIPLEGGWRIYSSGAGISTRLICHTFLGIRPEAETLVIDPIIPVTLDGLTAQIFAHGVRFKVLYEIRQNGFGPEEITINGTALPFTRLTNPYRSGGICIPWKFIHPHLSEENLLHVVLS